MADRETNFPARVAELIDRLSRLTRDRQFVDGLNPAQWEALRFVQRANRYSRTPSALAEFLGTTKGTVSQTLIALERKGLILRGSSSADRRVTILRLTPAGEELLTRDPVLGLERMAATLGPGITRDLAEGLGWLLASIQRETGVKSFGACALCCDHGCGDDGDGHVCGLTGETLLAHEADQICVKFRLSETDPANAAVKP